MTEQPTRNPTRDGVLRAGEKIAAILPPTPLLECEVSGTRVWCKAESLQPVGAFKIRGAWHRLTDLSDEERARGIVGVSSGNHAQGLAWAAARLGIAARIVMPADAPAIKLERTRALGAEVVLYDRAGGEDRDEVAASLIATSGATLVHAFGDPWVIEGQGTTGLEIAVQLATRGKSGPTRIIAPCGGGGLTAGLALACPGAEIVPVEPEGWDTLGPSLAAGKVVTVAPGAPTTICDALQPPATKPLIVETLHGRVGSSITVTDAEVRAAQRHAFAHLRLVIEPGGAAALAAALAGKVATDGETVLILSGGNVDPVQFAETLTFAD